MTTVPILQTTSVVAEDGVTVVSQPQFITVVPVEDGVSVLSLNTEVSVVQVSGPTVVPVNSFVNVVTDGEYAGPRFYFSPTPPLGAKINDIWIRTA